MLLARWPSCGRLAAAARVRADRHTCFIRHVRRDVVRPPAGRPARPDRALSSIACMSTDTTEQTRLHGGRLIARRLKAHGVSKLFTLSGGHIFPIYDGCREEGVDIVDVRHEQTAAFAAEG